MSSKLVQRNEEMVALACAITGGLAGLWVLSILFHILNADPEQWYWFAWLFTAVGLSMGTGVAAGFGLYAAAKEVLP